MALKAFVSVLIVACPCALALASPFTLGTAHRCLARQGIFLRSPEVLESLSQVNTILFDKTGTLTCGSSDAVEWMGAPLSGEERHRVALLASQSHHPMAASVSGSLACTPPSGPVLDFQEHAGRGMDGRVEGHSIRMGSSEYVRGSEPLSAPEPPTAGASPACGPQVPCSVVRPWTVLPGPDAPARRTLQGEPEPSTVHLSIDDAYRGRFELRLPLRPLAPEVVAALSPQYSVGLISGDTERDRDRFQELFHDSSLVQFRRNPTDKLEFVGRLQSEGRHVMMVGDGLNDAGALKQGDVGVALLEDLSGFSPASDVILSADSLACLPGMMRYARSSARIIRHALLLSGLYNAIGIAIASAGLLAPWVCAVLMPLSSVSVVLFATGAASWAASRQLHPTPSHGTIPPVNRRRGSVGWLMPQGGESQA